MCEELEFEESGWVGWQIRGNVFVCRQVDLVQLLRVESRVRLGAGCGSEGCWSVVNPHHQRPSWLSMLDCGWHGVIESAGRVQAAMLACITVLWLCVAACAMTTRKA